MPIPILTTDLLARFPQVQHGVSTRLGGVSPGQLCLNLSFSVGDDEENVRRNRELFFGEVGMDPGSVAYPGQVHSASVKCVSEPGKYAECDGLVTATRGVALAVSIADCVPILMFDPESNAIAAVHAGWRGTASGILSIAVEMLKEQFGTKPGNLVAFIGPAAGGCCYEVGEEVSVRFSMQYHLRHDRRVLLDLKRANMDQLLAAGLLPSNIAISPLCTITDTTLHSYRRDGNRSGRMLAVIGIRK